MDELSSKCFLSAECAKRIKEVLQLLKVYFSLLNTKLIKKKQMKTSLQNTLEKKFKK